MEKKKQMQDKLTKDLLGKIPLFFSQIVIEESSSANGLVNHVREIEVEAYNTKKFQSRGYHKPISKIQ